MYRIKRARASLNQTLKPESASGHHISFYFIAVTGSGNDTLKDSDKVSHIKNGNIAVFTRTYVCPAVQSICLRNRLLKKRRQRIGQRKSGLKRRQQTASVFTERHILWNIERVDKQWNYRSFHSKDPAVLHAGRVRVADHDGDTVPVRHLHLFSAVGRHR